MNSQWQKIAEKLSERLDEGIFKVWIEPLEAAIEGETLSLLAPMPYMAKILSSRFLGVLEQCAREVLGEATVVSIASKPAEEGGGKKLHRVQNCLPVPVCERRQEQKRSWRYSFKDFVVGESNRLAVAAAHDVCRANGDVQTLFVNASAGLGKTHLVQAVGQDISEHPQERKVDYLTAEEFTAKYVVSLKTNEVESFKDRLRKLDVLLFEDVHFLQNKPKIQETALSVVKTIQEQGGRVIFTSSFSPRELQKVDSQLVSSFCSGILTHIDRPDESMRAEIVRRKASAMHTKINDSVCLLLAEHLNEDVRQLESCLNSICFKANVLKTEVTCDLALEVLGEYAGRVRVPDLDLLTALVCENYGLDSAALNSRSRCQNYVVGRNTVFYLARKHTNLTLKEIGERFNRRHSTVLQGITSVERELAKSSPVGRQIAHIVALVEERAGLNS